MFAGCVVWAAAVNFGQFFYEDAAAVVSAAAAVLSAVTVWNDVVELPAAAALVSVVVAAYFAVEAVCGYGVELVHVAE